MISYLHTHTPAFLMTELSLTNIFYLEQVRIFWAHCCLSATNRPDQLNRWATCLFFPIIHSFDVSAHGHSLITEMIIKWKLKKTTPPPKKVIILFSPTRVQLVIWLLLCSARPVLALWLSWRLALGPLPSDGGENGVEEVEKSGHVGHHLKTHTPKRTGDYQQRGDLTRGCYKARTTQDHGAQQSDL